jgi:hypothetical protein
VFRGLAAMAWLALLSAAGCIGTEQRLHITVERYVSAVTTRDHRSLALLWAPYRRETAALSETEQAKRFEAFEAMIRASHEDAFNAAKRSGELAADPLGITIFRGLGLGKGAFSLPSRAALDPGGATAKVRTRINTNLDTLYLDSLPDGVRVYLPGFPLGRLETISVGFERLEDKKLLSAVEVDWILSRAPEGWKSPAGWLIEAVVFDAESGVIWNGPRRKS